MTKLTPAQAQVFTRICELLDRDGVGFVDEIKWADRDVLRSTVRQLVRLGVVDVDAIDGRGIAVTGSRT